MKPVEPSVICSWHAHVYFDAASRDAAWALRERIEVALAGKMEMGRFHERAVGPHPMWSYQMSVPTAHLTQVLSWLTLKHGALDLFIHPNTDDELRDHRDCALWLGQSHGLNLAALGG